MLIKVAAFVLKVIAVIVLVGIAVGAWMADPAQARWRGKMNKVALFLIIAVVIATATFMLIGVLLLPALGVEGTARTMISGGISGGAIALVYSTCSGSPMLDDKDRIFTNLYGFQDWG